MGIGQSRAQKKQNACTSLKVKVYDIYFHAAIFIRKMNNTYRNYEFADCKTAAYTAAVSPTLPPMHTQPSPRAQRVFCTPHLPFSNFTLSGSAA